VRLVWISFNVIIFYFYYLVLVVVFGVMVLGCWILRRKFCVSVLWIWDLL